MSAQGNKFIAIDIVNPTIDYLAMAQSMGAPASQLIGRVILQEQSKLVLPPGFRI